MTRLQRLVSLALCLTAGVAAAGGSSASSQTVYTAPGTFPTSLFASYYNNPTATSEQPQPVVTDPVQYIAYPYSLTDPNNIMIGLKGQPMHKEPVPEEYLVLPGSPRKPNEGVHSTVFRHDLVYEFVELKHVAYPVR